MAINVHTGRAPLKLYAGQLGKPPGKRSALERIDRRTKQRTHREAERKVAERAEPTRVPYKVLSKIGEMQDRATMFANGLERSHYLDQRLREKTL
jgi:hypothetical protein